MLGYISMNGTPGEADHVLRALAEQLTGAGLRLAGAIQINTDLGADCACDMDLRILGDDGPIVRISQSLGAGSSGCRLDGGALETAVARVQKVLNDGADIVILNKFAKQESFGRGFRDVIATALDRGVPVLTYVPEGYLDAFNDFAGDFAETVSHEAVADWCLGAVRPVSA